MDAQIPQDEQAILDDFRAGTRRGLETIYHAHYRALWGYSFSITDNASVADEIVADAFVKIWERRVQFLQYKALLAYLYAIARNGSLTHIRAVNRKNAHHASIGFLLATEEQSCEASLIRAELLRLILLESASLPPKTRAVFEKFFVDGRSVREIADELQVAAATIKIQKKAAVRKIRAALLKKGIAPGSLFWLGL